jgi:3-dehydroquinate synthetase
MFRQRYLTQYHDCRRLGAYHAPLVTFLDFTFLKTLPEAQVRNGFAELVKISAVAEKRVWDLLVAHGPELVSSRFGRADGADVKLKEVADEICWRGIEIMLQVGGFITVLYALANITTARVSESPRDRP